METTLTRQELSAGFKRCAKAYRDLGLEREAKMADAHAADVLNEDLPGPRVVYLKKKEEGWMFRAAWMQHSEWGPYDWGTAMRKAWDYAQGERGSNPPSEPLLGVVEAP